MTDQRGGQGSGQRSVLLEPYHAWYSAVYAAAWKALLPHANMVLPILYLQRHNFELILKELLEQLLGLIQDDAASCEIFAGTAVPGGDAPVSFKTHDLTELSEHLERALTRLGLSSLPDAFGEMVSLLDEVEQGSPERLRYKTIFDRQARCDIPSFDFFDGDEPMVMPIDQVAALLTDISSWASVPPLEKLPADASRPEKLRFFFDSLSDCHRRVERTIAVGLEEMERATRNGELLWALESGAQSKLATPAELDAVSRHVSRRHAACYGNRRVALFRLEVDGASQALDLGQASNVYVIAACREDGSLGPCLWPARYDSRLGEAVMGAVAERRADA